MRHTDLRQRDSLLAIGERLASRDLVDHEEGDLEYVSCMIQTQSEFGQWKRETTSVLSTPALLGFGAMLGIAKDLEELFPYGTNFQLRVHEDGSTHSRIGTIDDDNPVFIEALASRLAGRESEGLWVLTIDTDPSVLDHPALPTIQRPDVLLAAADYTSRLADRAIPI